MIHKSVVENYSGSIEELVVEIGDLRYDALSEFLELLAIKIRKDGDKDKSRNRIRLAKHLYESSDKLIESKSSIDKAWIICEPYTK